MSVILRRYGLGVCLFALSVVFLSSPLNAASWTLLNNAPPANSVGGLMLLLTDGSVIMQQNYSSQSWVKLTPDGTGSYINGTWSTLAPMNEDRLYFASQVLPDGRVWVLGGEYTGPHLDANWGADAEIYDPVANTWTSVAPYPSQTGCPTATVTAQASITAGSNAITGIPTTARFRIGWSVRGNGISANTTITAIDSLTSVHISSNANATNPAAALTFSGIPVSCYGDSPSILLTNPSMQILAGDLINNSANIYNVAGNNWIATGSKVYNDSSDEEGWVKQSDNSILNYDVFKSIASGTGFAERYISSSGTWQDASLGSLPLLSSVAVGFELGPGLRLLDGRTIYIGANNKTALYSPAGTWAPGPNIFGTLANSANPGGTAAPFGADDAAAAILPNGHVIFAADAGPAAFTTTGNTTAGSNIITNIPSTAILQTGWAVAQASSGPTVIPFGAFITSVDSLTQIHISQNALQTVPGLEITFGGTFSHPAQLFDFDPAGTITPVSPAFPDPGADLANSPAFITRMLMLPTGQILFSYATNLIYVYTPDGAASPQYQPVITGITYDGGGLFTLTGTQLNGQSAGAAYGDDAQMDENYPILRMTDTSGHVYYCRTTNWSTQGVATGSAPESVNFTLNPSMPAGTYNAVVTGAGISSQPFSVTITPAQAARTQTYLSASCGNASFSYGGNYSCSVSVGSNAGSATGSITYTFDGNAPVGLALSNGSAQFTLSTPNAGPHAVTIVYPQQGNFAGSGPNTQSFTVSQATTEVSLTPSNYYPAAGSGFTLSASVGSYSAPSPGSGTVTFFDNGTSIGGGFVNSQGQASLLIPAIASGYHSYTAQFSGSSNYAAGGSNTLSISAR